MTRRMSAVLWGVAAVVGGVLVLHWLHASSGGYAPADPTYSTSHDSDLPALVLYAAVAVIGVCLASIGWWRLFLVGVGVAYVVAALGGGLVPLLGSVPARMSAGGIALLEAALLAAPTWVVAEHARMKPRPLPIPHRLALPRRDQKALPSPKRA